MRANQLIPETAAARSTGCGGEIARENVAALHPLSFGQERLWFVEQLQPGTPAYNLSDVWRLRGPLQPDLFENSLNQLVRRQSALRTGICVMDGQPRQAILPFEPVPLPVIDLSAREDPEAEARRFIDWAVQTPMDIKGGGALFRAHLLRLHALEHIAVFTGHHMLWDGWSIEVFRREFSALYRDGCAGRPCTLPPLPLTYVEAAVRERLASETPGWRSQLDEWRRRLQGPLPGLVLPADHARPAGLSFAGATEFFRLEVDLTRSLSELSRRQGATASMLFLSAFLVLLHRYSGQEDLLIGSPIAGRASLDTGDLIGFFVNTLALRTDLSGDPPFLELLDQVRRVSLEAYSRQEIPFERVVRELQPERRLNRNPLFNVLLGYEGRTSSRWSLPEVVVEVMDIDPGTAKFDWSLLLQEREEGIHCAFEYSTELFEAETIRRVCRNFCVLLKGIVSGPARRLSQLPLLTEWEERRVLVEWNQTESPRDRSVCLHECFARQAAATPDAVALVDGTEYLTYASLDQRSNQLAHAVRSLGIRPGMPVAICIERTWRLVAALLGVLKAGAAYVPVDPAYPDERVRFMLHDTAAPLLITDSLRHKLLPPPETRVLPIDSGWKVFAGNSVDAPENLAANTDLAYILYTSGSTGQPKGVALEHGSATALVSWAAQTYLPEDLAGVLMSTSVCFDLSVFELFVPLCSGGAAILARNILSLPTLPAAHSVTLINTVPSAMDQLLRARGLPASVRVVNLAGEPVSAGLVDRIYAETQVKKVYDLYGPTETATYSTFALRQPKGAETIGRPIANEQVYVLDAQLRPVPIGAPGEIYIGGEGVARGYWCRPELTKQRFMTNPFPRGGRLYRTGDMGRWRADGTLAFLGRMDRQVKVAGYRIEPEETESVLRTHLGVRECVVVARRDDLGGRNLVGYYVPAQSSSLSAEALRTFLLGKLPEHMVPTQFVPMKELPRNAAGKVDYAALPKPGHDWLRAEKGAVTPRNDVELRLKLIWEDVLGVRPIGVEDSFFELGGHSLLATRITSRIARAFEIELAVRELFEAPTIAALAARIAGVQGAPRQGPREIPRRIQGAAARRLLDCVENLSENEVESLLRTTRIQ